MERKNLNTETTTNLKKKLPKEEKDTSKGNYRSLKKRIEQETKR